MPSECSGCGTSTDDGLTFERAVAEEGDSIQFLYRIIQGGADCSCGNHVAMLAGMPAPVEERARELLTELEAHSNITAIIANTNPNHLQLDLFNTTNNTEFLRSITEIDADNLTSIEALNRLYELRETARGKLDAQIPIPQRIEREWHPSAA